MIIVQDEAWVHKRIRFEPVEIKLEQLLGTPKMILSYSKDHSDPLLSSFAGK